MGKTLGKILTIIGVIVFVGSFFVAGPSMASEEASDGRFIAYDDGTVWDTRTNLLWAARDNGRNIKWEDAGLYCENYSAGGYDDWRMPTKDELKDLYDRLIFGNNGYHLTKLITLTGAFPWTSDVSGAKAAVVGFVHDRDLWFWESQKHKSRNRVLPVRYGKNNKIAAVEPQQEVVAPAPPPPPPPPPPPVVAPAPPPPPPPPPPVQEKVTITLNVKFDYNKSIVSEKYYSDIKRVADFMKKYPDTIATIEGHTDEIGTKEYNQKLSEDRAGSVLEYLVDKFEIEKKRLKAVGYGEDRPVDSNYTEEGRQNNRRVEAVIETMITR